MRAQLPQYKKKNYNFFIIKLLFKGNFPYFEEKELNLSLRIKILFQTRRSHNYN